MASIKRTTVAAQVRWEMTELVTEADQATAAGQLARARELLYRAAEETPTDPDLWLKLAAINRATGHLVDAMAAVNRALALREFDFTALAMKALLVEKADPDAAGEAWARALVQIPERGVHPAMAEAVERGEKLRDRWMARHAESLAAATADINVVDADAEWKIARFRTNTAHTTRAYHSEPTHFAYPGLREREFHPRHWHPWLDRLEAATDDIRGEFRALFAANHAEMVPYIQYAEHEALAQWRTLNQNRDWTAIHLLQNGRLVDANADQCPKTMRALVDIPQPQIDGAGPNAMFSLLAPGIRIPPHHGYNNARLVCHLPIIVPPGCWFRVGAETRDWREGSGFVFDDTIEHEALNPSDQLRVVLILDVWHPDLTDVEKEAVRRIIAAEGREQSGL